MDQSSRSHRSAFFWAPRCGWSGRTRRRSTRRPARRPWLVRREAEGRVRSSSLSRSALRAEPLKHAGIGPLEHRPGVAPERHGLNPEPLELARRRLEEDTRVPSGPMRNAPEYEECGSDGTIVGTESYCLAQKQVRIRRRLRARSSKAGRRLRTAHPVCRSSPQIHDRQNPHGVGGHAVEEPIWKPRKKPSPHSAVPTGPRREGAG